MLDAGAQQAVIGLPALKRLIVVLRERNLKPLEIVEDYVQPTRGIGGPAKILSVQQLPMDKDVSSRWVRGVGAQEALVGSLWKRTDMSREGMCG